MVRKFKLSRLLLCLLIIVSMAFSFAGYCYANALVKPMVDAALLIIVALLGTIGIMFATDMDAFRAAEIVYKELDSTVRDWIDDTSNIVDFNTYRATHINGKYVPPPLNDVGIVISAVFLDMFITTVARVTDTVEWYSNKGKNIEYGGDEQLTETLKARFAPLSESGYLIQGYPVVSEANLGKSNSLFYYKSYILPSYFQLEAKDYTITVVDSYCKKGSEFGHSCPVVSVSQTGNSEFRYQGNVDQWNTMHSDSAWYNYQSNPCQIYFALMVVDLWLAPENKIMVPHLALSAIYTDLESKTLYKGFKIPQNSFDFVPLGPVTDFFPDFYPSDTPIEIEVKPVPLPEPNPDGDDLPLFIPLPTPEPDKLPTIGDLITNPQPIINPNVDPVINPDPNPQPQPNPDPNPNPNPQPEPLPEPNPEVQPLPNGEVNWDKLINGWSGLGSTFPFCIPWDLVTMINSLRAPPTQIPVFEANIAPYLGGNAGLLKIDLLGVPGLDKVLKIVRIFELLIFCAGLALLTGKVIKW